MNILAILIATTVSFFLGFLWYNILFTKPWMKAMGLTSEDVRSSGISLGSAITGSLIASLVSVIGLAVLFSFFPNLSLSMGLFLALIVWLGFSLTPMFKLIFWEDRPPSLFAIDAGYEFCSIMAASVVLVFFG